MRGNKYLKSALVMSARSAVKSKGTRFAEQYERIKERRGGKKAIIAVARSMLIIIYEMIKNGSSYEERV